MTEQRSGNAGSVQPTPTAPGATYAQAQARQPGTEPPIYGTPQTQPTPPPASRPPRSCAERMTMAVHESREAETRSVAALLSDLVRDMTELVRSETRLVRSEINESGRKLAAGAEMLAAGAIIMLLAAIVLLQALVIALAQWVGPTWAAVIVVGVLFVIGGLLMVRGKKDLFVSTPLPECTVGQASRDTQLAKEQFK